MICTRCRERPARAVYNDMCEDCWVDATCMGRGPGNASRAPLRDRVIVTGPDGLADVDRIREYK